MLTANENSLTLEPRESLETRAIASACAGLSPATRRVYGARLRTWLKRREPLDREHVKRYLSSLESAGATPQVRNQTLAALKRLATEAAEIGWIEHQAAAQIERVKSTRLTGIRTGRWLSAAEAARLLGAIDRTNTTGKRDAATLALLLGCGLRRAEAVGLDVAQLVTRDGRGRTIITNLIGKGGRLRSVAVPGWAQRIIEEWKTELEKSEPEIVSWKRPTGQKEGHYDV